MEYVTLVRGNETRAARACRILYTTDIGSTHRGNSTLSTREYLHL